MTFYKKIALSSHNRYVLRFFIIGLILWPTPLPGLVLFVIPSILLFDFKIKRVFDVWFWNSNLGSFIYSKVNSLLSSLNSHMALYLNSLAKHKHKKKHFAYIKSIKQFIKHKIIIPSLYFVKQESSIYQTILENVKLGKY